MFISRIKILGIDDRASAWVGWHGCGGLKGDLENINFLILPGLGPHRSVILVI